MSAGPGADELQIRSKLRRLGVSLHPETPAPEPEETTGERDLERAPSEHEAPAVPRQRAAAPRLPAWWEPVKPELTTETPADLAPAPQPEESAQEPDDGAEQEETAEDDPEQPPPVGLRDRIQRWAEAAEDRAGTRPPGAPADPREDPAEDEPPTAPTAGEEVEKKDGPSVAAAVEKTARLVWRPRRRPRFSAPGIPVRERKSLIEWARSIPPQVIWLGYTGSAAGLGWYFGLPQWVKDSVIYLAQTQPSWDTAYCWTCYGIAGLAVLLDYRTRGWILPLAWGTRIPSASLALGIALYGVQTPISELF